MIVILLVLTPLLSFSQSENDIVSATIVAKLHEKASVIFNVKAEVQLATHSEIFEQVLTTPYEMYYSKPEYFRLEKLTGDREVFVVNEDEVLHSTNGNELTKSNNNRMVGVIHSLMSQLISASYTDEKSFEVNYSEVFRGYSVILKPKRSVLSKSLERIELILNKEDVSIIEMKLFQSEFEYFIYSFSSVDYNSEIDPKKYSSL